MALRKAWGIRMSDRPALVSPWGDKRVLVMYRNGLIEVLDITTGEPVTQSVWPYSDYGNAPELLSYQQDGQGVAYSQGLLASIVLTEEDLLVFAMMTTLELDATTVMADGHPLGFDHTGTAERSALACRPAGGLLALSSGRQSETARLAPALHLVYFTTISTERVRIDQSSTTLAESPGSPLWLFMRGSLAYTNGLTYRDAGHLFTQGYPLPSPAGTQPGVPPPLAGYVSPLTALSATGILEGTSTVLVDKRVFTFPEPQAVNSAGIVRPGEDWADGPLLLTLDEDSYVLNTITASSATPTVTALTSVDITNPITATGGSEYASAYGDVVVIAGGVLVYGEMEPEPGFDRQDPTLLYYGSNLPRLPTADVKLMLGSQVRNESFF